MAKAGSDHPIAAIEEIGVTAYTIPAEQPESDGTLKWNSTTLVLVEIEAGDTTGIGYTYANESAATLIRSMLQEQVKGLDCFDIPGARRAMISVIRNQGHCGIAYMAVSAVDTALWDLKAKLLNLPLVKLIGMKHSGMPIYGSGGFTSYTIEKMQQQLENWVRQGISQVKIKTGRRPENDVQRVKAARECIGDETELMVDANGAYSEKQAMKLAGRFAEYGISWLEEPVSSDNLEGLQHVREKAPAGVEVTAGEYGYHLSYFKHMLQAGAVDVLQADATRCGGITGFLQAGTVAEAFLIPFSSHCAPALHLHAAPALENFRHAEYFYDHVRIERMLFDGVQIPENGTLKPDLSRPGMGIEFKHQDAQSYKL